MSWESTSTYYSLLNTLTAEALGPWHQPALLVDSLDFSEIVRYQQLDDWSALGSILADSARRLESAGATTLAICANTMHINFDQVAGAVSIPVVDVRDAMVGEVRALGATSMTLMGTKYVMERDFYSAHLELAGVKVVVPLERERDQLQAIIYDELTQGIVSEASRQVFFDIAESCRERGGDVVGLCCTEFGLLVNDDNAPWPLVDSTVAHVRALIES